MAAITVTTAAAATFHEAKAKTKLELYTAESETKLHVVVETALQFAFCVWIDQCKYEFNVEKYSKRIGPLLRLLSLSRPDFRSFPL